MTNLLSDLPNVDLGELKILLNKHIGGPGQFDGHADSPNIFCLPLAGPLCQISLIFKGKNIVAIEPGEAFSAADWKQDSEEITKSIIDGPVKIGREYSFSSFRVLGSWRGNDSQVQILPPPDSAPRAKVEMADHPFILEFPIKESDFWPVTNYRRQQMHRRLTLLLNVLLVGRASLQPRRSDHFWACWSHEDGTPEYKWAQQFFFAEIGQVVIDELSPASGKSLKQVEPEEYYTKVGHDGKGLRVPTDLDQSISLYFNLSLANRARFDRATFWMDMASRQWNISVSASFAALVSAIESLTDRGNIHRFNCPTCGDLTQHEVPGATRRFKDFFDTYAPGTALSKRRNEMYSLRSGVLHGSELMQLDHDLTFGWDPPQWNEYDLQTELWGITRIALRNWLKSPPKPQAPI